MLSLGIVGLPNAGKSTLFNALTRSKQAKVENYPFCTIEPNVGVVEVPDERLPQIFQVSNSKKMVPTAIEFIDIAGLVKGAHQGEGLGNQFLSHIREVDAVIQVVRAFEDPNVSHVHNKIEPKQDVEIVNLELILADWQTVSKRLEKTKKQAKGTADKKTKTEIDLLEKIYKQLEAGKLASELEYGEKEKEILKELNLLSLKPILYVVNIDEIKNHKPVPSKIEGSKNINLGQELPQIEVCAKLEAELADLNLEEAKEYLKESGIEQSGLDKLIVEGYKLLDLITFYSSTEAETRAWTIKQGTKAPQAAGRIHTDFEKKFIKVDVCPWQDFVACRGWGGAKERGKVRLEGREYIVKDGEVCYFHVST